MSRTLLVLCLGVVLGCAEENPARHLPDAPTADAAAPVDLVVAKAGNGSGTITSSPDGIDCGAVCKAAFAPSSTVVLTAQPDSGSLFSGWSGACSGEATTCEVALEAATSVTATFTLEQHAVTLTKSGPGNGKIQGSGADCDASCTLMVDHGTTLSFSAAPGALAVFGGWGGACTGMATCDVTVTDDVAVNASFALDNFTLFVVRSGSGQGTVASSPAGISCGTDCDHVYTANQVVTLSASAATGSTFNNWAGGGCSGTSPTCATTLTGVKTVTAMFKLNQYALTVAKTGQGTVTGSGINCGTDCSETLNHGTPVTLSATPATGYSFTNWSGACTGTGACNVTMDAAKSVTANFAINTYALTVSKVGSGTVTGTGIACGTDCTETYNHGTPVTLTATPATGYSFTGWSGACSGAGACTLSMTAARAVTATFTINTYALTVAKVGSGTVTGNGIACGTDCTETMNHGTPVTLTATPATGYSFTNWSGACSGTGTCSVTMDAAKSVTATFTLNTYALNVAKVGSGTVTGSGIACGTDCTETYNHGTPVTLTATPATGYSFTNWSGACSGSGTCSVTMDAAKSVTATFTLNTYALNVAKVGSGTVTGSGIACGTDCTETYNHGTPVTLTATPATGYSFTNWSGACTGTGSCTVSMTAARSVTATFTINTHALTVSKVGSGTVAGTGITCGTDCTETFNHGTPVTLTATPSTNYTFTGWSGACTGMGTCTVSMTAARSVTATFGANVVVTPSGNGTVTRSATGVSCGTNCTAYPIGTALTLTAVPAPNTSWFFSSWGGDCASAQFNSTCSLTINAPKTATAFFAQLL